MVQDFTPATTHMALSALRMLRPRKLIGVNKVRLGRPFDGGYVMADLFQDIEAAYSLGIKDDVSWDLDVATMGIPCFQYDPTIDALPQQHELFNWKPYRIDGHVDRANASETLESLIIQNGHERAKNLLLKCDIEGSEWSLLKSTPSRILRQFRQMVFEFHNLHMLADPNHSNNVRNTFLNLTAHHHVVHVHANNYGGWEIIGGVPVPAVIELTLVRKDVGQFELSDEVFPSELDMPNAPQRSDLYLGHFVFE